MKTLKENAPVLWTIFFKSYELVNIERPYGCSDCPFAKEHGGWGSVPDPADRDEGYYDCDLLGSKKIWRESPQCSAEDWRNKGSKEIEAIANYTIQQEIIEEKATKLIQQFAEALQDDANGNLTLNQIKEKLLVGVEPQVLYAFNVKLRPMGSI